MTDSTMGSWVHTYSGKVRDLYTSAEHPGRMLLVATDRVSAFDHVLEPGIPSKGELLTTLSLWWFDQLSSVPNHVLSPTFAPDAADPDAPALDAPAPDASAVAEESDGIPAAVAGRAMIVKALEMFPVECVVRGYLAGSGWAEYQRFQSVCGVPLPAGLHPGDRLPEPIYTPAFKAPMGAHDENISFERTVELVGAADAESLRSLSLDVFARASVIAEERGVILADTKFEFGRDPVTGAITLADEVLTSDSSRFWDAAAWESGNRTDSFDKQIVRNWLATHWDQHGTDAPPSLPAEIVEQTATRYRELVTRLTGE